MGNTRDISFIRNHMATPDEIPCKRIKRMGIVVPVPGGVQWVKAWIVYKAQKSRIMLIMQIWLYVCVSVCVCVCVFMCVIDIFCALLWITRFNCFMLILWVGYQQSHRYPVIGINNHQIFCNNHEDIQNCGQVCRDLPLFLILLLAESKISSACRGNILD